MACHPMAFRIGQASTSRPSATRDSGNRTQKACEARGTSPRASRKYSSTIVLALSLSAAHADPRLSPRPAPEEPATEVELADAALAATPAAREQLRYLATCALPQGTVLHARPDAERFTFPGKMGLAPGWLTRSMTTREERWMSACMFSMSNYFGKHVEVSFRAEPPPVAFLQATESETRRFPIFEGGFFGNLFGPQSVAYVCQGARTPADDSEPVFDDRVCAKAKGTTRVDGKTVTYCGFIVAGACADPATFTVNGQHYEEVIFTYLKAAAVR